MRLLADENMPAALIAVLRRVGHDVQTATAGTPDSAVAAQSAKENRVLITQDKNLGNLLEYPPRKYAGIILLRFHPPLLEDISKALDVLFTEISAAEFAGKLFVLDRDGIRVRT